MNYPIRTISLTVGPVRLHARLSRPENARALVILAHLGPHPTESMLAANLAARNLAILAIDLLTPQESHFHSDDDNTARLAQRLMATLDFVRRDGDTETLGVGLHASGHSSAAAVRAAAQRDALVQAVVVHGGLIDHAGRQYLEALMAPLLVLVDAGDTPTEAAAQRAFQHIGGVREMSLIDPQNAVFKTASWFGQWLS